MRDYLERHDLDPGDMLLVVCFAALVLGMIF